MREYIFIVGLILLAALVNKSCDDDIARDKAKQKFRKYEVTLSDFGGTYYCDSILFISKREVKLKKNEDSTYFLHLIIPEKTALKILEINDKVDE